MERYASTTMILTASLFLPTDPYTDPYADPYASDPQLQHQRNYDHGDRVSSCDMNAQVKSLTQCTANNRVWCIGDVMIIHMPVAHITMETLGCVIRPTPI